MKHLRIFLLSMAVLALMGGSAFAGTTLVNAGAAGANFQVSLEAMGAARNVTVIGTVAAGNLPGTAAIGYTAAQALATQNLLNVAFSGAAFTGVALNICAMNSIGDALVANATPTAGSTNANFQLNGAANANLGSGNSLYITSGACGGAGINAPVQISATAVSAKPTVQISAQTAGGILIDTSTAKQLANIAPEYSVVNNNSLHTIDFLSTPFNGTKIISVGGGASNVTADANAAGVTNSVGVLVAALPAGASFTSNGSPGAGAQNAALTVSAVVNLQDSASWQGVKSVYLVAAGAACTIAANVVINSAPANTVTLTIPTTAGGFNGTATAQYDLCVQADGVSSLQTRVITAADAITVSGGGTVPAAPFANAMTWNLNAYQAVIPFVVNSAVVPTFCLVNNGAAARTGTVLVDVLSSEGAVVLTNLNLGSLAPQKSQLFEFQGNEIDTVSTTGVTAKVADLTALGANTRYAPRLTVTVNPNNVQVSCIQTDPSTGVKRLVPVLSNATNFNQ